MQLCAYKSRINKFISQYQQIVQFLLNFNITLSDTYTKNLRRCRNLLIHGYCKFQDKGCEFNHDIVCCHTNKKINSTQFLNIYKNPQSDLDEHGLMGDPNAYINPNIDLNTHYLPTDPKSGFLFIFKSQRVIGS